MIEFCGIFLVIFIIEESREKGMIKNTDATFPEEDTRRTTTSIARVLYIHGILWRVACSSTSVEFYGEI